MYSSANSNNYKFGKWLSSPRSGEEVIISGLSGRFPKCNNVEELCDNLFNKHDMVDESTRWNLKHPEIPKRSGTIPNLFEFDAGFFGLHQRQVKNADPVLGKFLEVTVEAVIDAGVHPSDLENSRTGVFVGCSWLSAGIKKMKVVKEQQQFAVTGYTTSMIAQRLSFFLKLKGPSYNLDTACSSSLNALDHAFRAIRTGQCDQALVGGAHLILHPGETLQFFRVGVLSTDGKCRVFDQDASGYVRSETVACIFLQKAKNSKRIYARIIHSKINTDGFKSAGLLFPSSSLQGTLIKEVYDESGIKPSQLSYFEVHGTGTKVGDLQEVQALDEVIGKHRNKPLWIGSVKSNLGHPEPASGLSSLAKVLLAMQTGYIAPNLHFENPKEGMDALFEERLVPVTDKVVIDNDAIVGISNFGFGGNNCHVVLQRHDKKKVEDDDDDDISKLVCVSGRTEEAVRKILEEVVKQKKDNEWINMLQNVFKKEFPNHLYRGFIIVGKNRSIIKAIKPYSKKSPKFYVRLTETLTSRKTMTEYFSQFRVFKIIVKECQKDIKKITTDVNKNDLKNCNFLGDMAIQVCFIKIIQMLDLTPVILGENFVVNFLSKLPSVKKHVKLAEHISSNSIILDFSDANFQENPAQFLEFVGRLFQLGYNPQVQKLYQDINYPVSRGTPMIAPLIKWNYNKKWPVVKFNCLENATDSKFEIDLNQDEYKYVTGHVINDRNLFPATGYLYMIWQVLAEKKFIQITNTPVIFENCKFVRATTMTKNRIQFSVNIQEVSGNFEFLVNDMIAVKGKVYYSDKIKQHQMDVLKPEFKEKNSKFILNTDEVYKELNLRGYNYSGLFRGLQKCNVEATNGLLQWNNNWAAFMDCMLQLKILQIDSRMLYVPTGIKKIVIDPQKHLEIIQSAGDVLPVIASRKYNIIKSGGIEIHGLLAKAISKRKLPEPVLEKYEFISNDIFLDLAQSVRVNIQIILEESLEDDVKALEIIDEYSEMKNSLLMPLIYGALENIPVVRPNLVISSKSPLEETPGIKIEPLSLSQVNNQLIIVGTKILRRPDFLKQVLMSLSKNGFALTREEKYFIPKDIGGITILTQHITENEKLILFKKSTVFENSYIEISSTNFNWITELQKSMKNNWNVVVYSEKEESDGILGFINCIRREPRGIRIKCFFIMDKAPTFDPLDPFYKKQIEKNQAINIYKNSQWGTYRHLLLEEPSPVIKKHSFVSVTSRGDLSSLKWVEGPLHNDDKNENIIYTYYSAINFKDIMTASARIVVQVHRKYQDQYEGFEYCGKDCKGNRIMGILPNGAVSTLIVADPDLCWPVPQNWTLEEAATVPVVYGTVIYALLMRTSLKEGTSILIHSATGGIGIAALHVALHHKCEIFVTVGTEEKRNFLKSNFPQISDSHIGNSRDTSFEEMVIKETGGRGVDIVLNSLAEEKLRTSIRCLAQFGRFMEIGKFDMVNNNELSLLLMQKQASYHGVMVDHIMEGPSILKQQFHEKFSEAIREGYIKPLPRTVFNHDAVESAFRYMTTGKHIGKILIKIREDENEQKVIPQPKLLKCLPRYYCDPNKSYIILGGLGGFGLELADWLVLRGAKKLILTSRSGIQNGYQTQRIKIWESYGVNIHIFTIDTSSKQNCLTLIEKSNEIGIVDGIFNLAVVLDDALFEDQNKEKFEISATPKAQAIIYLDEITRKLCPDLKSFVVFSSVSCGRGNAGQTNYGMANSVMERICEKRKLDGYPAVAIQWGAIGDVGLVAKMQKENKELVIGGTLQQKISSCLDVMDRFLNQDNPVVASMVVAEKRDKSLNETPLDTVTKIIGIRNLKTVSFQATLTELGMDSIMGTEIIQTLEKGFDIHITAKEIRNLTLARLTEMSAELKTEQKKDRNLEIPNHLMRHVPSCEVVDSPFQEFGDIKQNKTIFVFPGFEGVFVALNEILKLEARILGVLYNYKNPENELVAIAELVAPHIEKHLSKSEEFYFIGYSFGVSVALEVASRLEKKNYYGKIAAIDGSPQYSSETLKLYAPGETDNEFETMLINNIFGFFTSTDVLFKQKDKLLSCNNFNERIDFALSFISSDQKKLYKEASVIVYKRLNSIRKYNLTSEKIKSIVKLYKAECSSIKDIENDYGLSQLCTQPVNIVTIEGNHETILLQKSLLEDIEKFLNIV